MLLPRGGAFQSSPPQFHGQKSGDGEDVASYVRAAYTVVRRWRKRRLEQIADLLQRATRCGARIKLFDRLDSGEALRSRIFHRVEIFIREQAK